MGSKHGTWVIQTFIGLVAVSLVRGANICFDCQDETDPEICKSFSTCDAGLICYRELVETAAGEAKYNWGCASKELCQLESSLAGRKRASLEKCFECCEDNFCNFGGCSKDYCASIKCQNGGTCVNLPLKGECQCANGYTGLNCETEINECESNPCQNGGTCQDFVGSYTCTCIPGYTGENCEIDIDECASSPCQNNATCVDDVNGYTCICELGYNGTFCEIDIDECAPGPCQYNGTCIDLVNDYMCDCIPGITGTDCETNIDECANATCENGATCVDLINDFRCDCVFGFDGDLCEISLGRVCYDCEDAESIDNCTNQIICGKNEECFIEHELLAPGDYNFNLGCVPTAMCSILGGGARTGRNTRPIQLCYECCDYNGCNDHACADTIGNMMGNSTNP